jgi:hypothetical protein
MAGECPPSPFETLAAQAPQGEGVYAARLLDRLRGACDAPVAASTVRRHLPRHLLPTTTVEAFHQSDKLGLR